MTISKVKASPEVREEYMRFEELIAFAFITPLAR